VISDLWMSWWSLGLDLPEDRLACWRLSVALASRHYKVHLVTDSPGASRLEKLPFASVSLALDKLNLRYRKMWALGKIEAIREALAFERPFLHIDGDVFLWQPLPESLMRSGIVAESPEPLIFYDWSYPIDYFWKNLGHVPADFRKGSSAYNCGIMGGCDLNFWKRYVDQVRELIFHPCNKTFWTSEHPVGIATTAEQYMLGAVADSNARNVTTLLGDRLSHDGRNYQHLATMKKNPGVMGSVIQRVSGHPYDLEYRPHLVPEEEIKSRSELCFSCDRRMSSDCGMSGTAIESIVRHGACWLEKW